MKRFQEEATKPDFKTPLGILLALPTVIVVAGLSLGVVWGAFYFLFWMKSFIIPAGLD